MADNNKTEQEFNPELYEEEELACVESHMEKYFGKYDNVFHEIISPDIHVDIAIIEPTAERDYYILVTMGMGAHRMNTPPELAEYKIDRAELVVCLPADWNLKDFEDENCYWPLRWLKILARLPGEHDTWLGWGHTVPAGEPFADNTKFSCMLLISPEDFAEGCDMCEMPDGSVVNYYQMIPLYEEEMNYKLAHDAEELLDIMDDDILVVDVKRKNYCDK